MVPLSVKFGSFCKIMTHPLRNLASLCYTATKIKPSVKSTNKSNINNNPLDIILNEHANSLQAHIFSNSKYGFSRSISTFSTLHSRKMVRDKNRSLNSPKTGRLSARPAHDKIATGTSKRHRAVQNPEPSRHLLRRRIIEPRKGPSTLDCYSILNSPNLKPTNATSCLTSSFVHFIKKVSFQPNYMKKEHLVKPSDYSACVTNLISGGTSSGQGEWRINLAAIKQRLQEKLMISQPYRGPVSELYLFHHLASFKP
ncbi:uncharacterized protein LOC131945811 isoform X1 [Physella acuta]|uniref:uncharacterized protein LOC131945811 isoform X1 n=1 Tax=Physella acuta TaxID=109671 RepID=UPI0027DBDDA2|nr:uncharacterized protein LOC131945811 isoform X1 [Physella acuta]